MHPRPDMRQTVLALSVCALVAGGCHQPVPGEMGKTNPPPVDVNKPRPNAIVEPTNQVGVPLTNVPSTPTAPKK